MGCICECHGKIEAVGVNGCCWECEADHDPLRNALNFHLEVLGSLAKACVPTPQEGYLKPPWHNVGGDIADLAAGKYAQDCGQKALREAGEGGE